MAHTEPIPAPGRPALTTPGDQENHQPTTPTDDADSTSCPECQGAIIQDGRERRCKDCGLIVTYDQIDRGAEWRQDAFKSDTTGHNTARCNGRGHTETLHDKGLGTTFDGIQQSDRQFSRMETLHRQAKFKKKTERNLAYGFAHISRMTTELGLGRELEERACRLYRNAQDADLFRGRSLELVAGACVYAVCREHKLPRLPDEVAAIVALTDEEVPGESGVTRALQNAYGKICRELGLGFEPLSPAAHIPQIASELDVHDATKVKAMQLARRAAGAQPFVGRTPSGVAAAAMYVACEQLETEITQVAVSDAGSVAPVTVREIAALFEELPEDDPDETTAEESTSTSTSTSGETESVVEESGATADSPTNVVDTPAVTAAAREGRVIEPKDVATSSSTQDVTGRVVALGGRRDCPGGRAEAGAGGSTAGRSTGSSEATSQQPRTSAEGAMGGAAGPAAATRAVGASAGASSGPQADVDAGGPVGEMAWAGAGVMPTGA